MPSLGQLGPPEGSNPRLRCQRWVMAMKTWHSPYISHSPSPPDRPVWLLRRLAPSPEFFYSFTFTIEEMVAAREAVSHPGPAIPPRLRL